MPPVKILHASKKYPDVHGGDAVVVSNLERMQVLAGHRVTILTSNCAQTQRRPGIHVFGLKDNPESLDRISLRRLISLVMLIFQAFRILRRERPDIIHTHSVDMSCVISLAARIYRIPIVHTFHIVTSREAVHGFVRNRAELRLMKAARPAFVTALNRTDLEHLTNSGLNVVLVPNGLDLTVWTPIELQSDHDRFALVSVGRLEKHKGFPLLIEAAALLDGEVDVKIIGGGSLESELQLLINASNVAERVELTGPKTTEGIREIFARSDAMVISSLYEAMPLALLEAWASGLPVITTEVGMVQRTEAGTARGVHLITDREPATLAAAIRRLRDDRAYRESLVEAGFDEVRQYTWTRVTAALDGYYEDILARRPSKQRA
jgi:glycosyltransferase involved in cell wall biosynthesis